MLPVIFPVLIGGALGAALGYFGQCSSGTCPLTATWWRGALYGAVMGLVFGLLSSRNSSGEMNKSSQFVKQISETAFDSEVAKANLPVVVDFYAPWCGPCRTLAPRMEKLAEQYSGKIKFVKVNVDDATTLATQYKISGIPTLLFFHQGKMVDSMVGLPPAAQLQQRLETLAGQKQAKLSAP